MAQRLRQRWRGAALFAAGALAAFAAFALFNALTPAPPQLTAREVDEAIAQALASATPAPSRAMLVYQAVQPSLVLIQVQAPGERGKPKNGLGSGVVIDDRGDILTALHVITGATGITLTFADGFQSGALMVASQPDKDIAVLRATQPPTQVVPAVLGNPRAMRVGDDAYVVGNPFGLYSSMSAGVISGFDRTFRRPDGERELEGLIQIDAAVNPGNSGGPLLNRDGHVVGIVTGIINPTEQEVFIGIGFAVPIDAAGGAAGSPPY